MELEGLREKKKELEAKLLSQIHGTLTAFESETGFHAESLCVNFGHNSVLRACGRCDEYFITGIEVDLGKI